MKRILQAKQPQKFDLAKYSWLFCTKGRATNEHLKVKYVKSSMACEAAQNKLRFERTDPGENPPGFPKVFADSTY